MGNQEWKCAAVFTMAGVLGALLATEFAKRISYSLHGTWPKASSGILR